MLQYRPTLAALVGCIFCGALSAPASTLRVPSQYSTINQAMDVAVEEDTVLVAPGTYSEAEERYVNLIGVPIPVTSLCFFANGVTLKSEAGPEGTVLDLQGQASSWGYGWVLLIAQLPSLETRIEGFTLTGAPTGNHGVLLQECGHVRFASCVFKDFDARGFQAGGGGIASSAVDVDFIECKFMNCKGDIGGASSTGAAIS